MKRLFIIDAMAMAYRNFYGVRGGLSTSSGQPVSAVYGTAGFMTKLMERERPDYLIVCSDSQKKTFRHDMLQSYKANRKEMPDELRSQLPHIYRLFSALGIPVIREEGVEADDLIGSVVSRFEGDELESYIVSGDKDMMQLVSDRCFLYSPKSGDNAVTGKEGVKKRFAVSPSQVPDVLALMGDSSDNIPGVAGIGEKTACKLILEHGSIEALYADIDGMETESIQKRLKAGRENAFLAKRLTTIKRDCEISLGLSELRVDLDEALTSDALISFYRELEFRVLLEKTLERKSLRSV